MVRNIFIVCVGIYAIGFFLTASWISAAPDQTAYCPKFNIEHNLCGRADASFAGFFLGFVWPVYWTSHFMFVYRKEHG